MTAARDLTHDLGGRWHGSYGMVACPAHDDHNPSLKLIDGDSGVVVHCFSGCSWRDVKAALGIAAVAAHGAASTSTPRPPSGESGRIRAALALWKKAQPAAGTLAERYLRSRGITIEIPPSIRFLAKSRHRFTDLLLPALLSAVQGVDRRVTGVLRTFLTADGTRKAEVILPKMMLGRVKGGAVRLGPVAPKIAVAEGLETALSIAQACPGLSVWAALSTSGMTGLELPPEVREVILCCDGDIPGKRAGLTAAKRFIAEGRSARICAAPPGRDYNDVHMGPDR